ncbi:Acetyltransferase (GNAT) family protein [compost metagenome]
MKLVKVTETSNQKDGKLLMFGKLKVALIKEHQQYANELGLQDKVVENYSYERAIKHIGEEGYYAYLIQVDDVVVGMLEYNLTVSDIDNARILYLHNVYIEKGHRGKGLGKEVINIVKKLGLRVELECWYNLPAHDFYKSLGAKAITTRYIL